MEIPFFPDYLQIIPPAPVSADDPDRDELRAAYAAWRLEAMRYRIQRRDELARDPGLIPFEIKRCKHSFIYWLTMWATLHEPRRIKTGYGPIPFIPTERQAYVADKLFWTLDREDENADALLSKCRTWGASWLFCAIMIWGWLFLDPWIAFMISRTEDLVDSKQAKSLFTKIDFIMHRLPEWMVPEKYDSGSKKYRTHMTMIHPENGNELVGEATTTNAGRASRATVVFIDEGAVIPRLIYVYDGLTSVSEHRWITSTENMDEGDDFYRLQTDPNIEHKPLLLTADWWENPLLDDEWFEKEKKRFKDPAMFEREILRNLWAADSHWVYPWAWDIQIDEQLAPTRDALPFISVDPGWQDETAIIAAQEIDGVMAIMGSYENSRQPADFYVPILKPFLFEEINPMWRIEPEMLWSNDAGEVFHYNERDLAFAALVADLGAGPTFVGDTYGDTVSGATMDSVYSRWQRYDILVNRDRMGQKDLSKYREQARQDKGRREALGDRKSRISFAPPAAYALQCLQNHRYRAQNAITTSAPRRAAHDRTSHLVTAMEFLAVHFKFRREIMAYSYQRNQKASLKSLGRHTQLTHKTSFAQSQNRTRLG